MKREIQEAVFVEQVEKRIDQLATEFDLSYAFVVGALNLIVYSIQKEYFEENDD